jgi:hypothetical protein
MAEIYLFIYLTSGAPSLDELKYNTGTKGQQPLERIFTFFNNNNSKLYSLFKKNKSHF